MNVTRVGILLGSSLIIVAFSAILFSAAKFHYNLEHETPEERNNHEVFLEISIFISYIMFGISIFYIVLTILLIVGVVKKYQKLINNWFYCTVAGLVLESLLALWGFHQLVGLLIIQLSVCILLYRINDDKKEDCNEAGDNASQYV